MSRPVPALSTSSLVLLLTTSACILLLAMPQQAQAQNYHYSNGWHPGKRAMMNSMADSAEDDACVFRPRVLALVNKIIMDEVSRIQQSCYSMDTVGAFKALLQQSAEGASPKMADDTGKTSW